MIPNRDWKLLCMCVYKYIYTYTYLKKHAFPLPPLYFLIILFCIKTYCLSINISFPSEFRISRISDSNFFFMGFTPLCSYSKYFYVKWKLRSCAQDTCTFLLLYQQFSRQNGYRYNFMRTMIFFKEFYEYEPSSIVAST